MHVHDGCDLWRVEERPNGEGQATLLRVADASGGHERLVDAGSAVLAGPLPPPAWARVRCADVRDAGCALGRLVDGMLRIERLDPRTGGLSPWVERPRADHDLLLSWDISPDGSQLAVLDMERHRALVVDAAGEVEREVLPEKGDMPYRLAWHPDGRRVALLVQRRADPTRRALALVSVEDDETVTHDLAPGQIPGYLAWEPGGRRVVISAAGVDADAFLLSVP